MMRLFLATLSLGLLSACGEPDQTASHDRYLPDAHASTGAENPYVAAGWTPGDRNSWSNQLRARGQSQNEYLKTP